MNNYGIAQANGRSVLLKKDGNTDDIIRAVLDTVPEVINQTRGFSRQFRPTREGMYQLWAWVRSNIRYREDPLGKQWIREPARLWRDREGDCKSMTLFIVSVLENLNVDYIIRFSNTERAGKQIVNHVYPIAVLPSGEEIIVDAVYPQFDREANYYFIKDYDMTQISRLSGIGAAQVLVEELDQYAQDIQRLTSDIGDSVLDDDITEMSDGEFARYQSAQLLEAKAETAKTSKETDRYNAAAAALKQGSVAGIGNLAPSDRNTIVSYIDKTATMTERAFRAPVLEVPEAIRGVNRHKIAGILDNIKNAWKKLTNWLFKDGFLKSSPFMLYLFLKKKKVGKKTDAKIKKAEELMQYNMDTGQFKDPYTIMQAYRIGITKQMGKEPDKLLNDAAQGKATVAGAGIGNWLDAIGKAIGVVIDIIGKIAGLFKKKKKPEVAKSDAPDDKEFYTEIQAGLTSDKSITPGTSATTPSSSGNMMPIVLGGVALVGLFLLTRK